MGSAEGEKENIAMCSISLRCIKNALYLRSHFANKSSKQVLEEI